MSRSGDFRSGERREGWAVPLDAVAAFTQGASVSVAPDRIEQELVSLWRRASERASAQGAGFAVTRACQWNLIVHTHGEGELLAQFEEMKARLQREGLFEAARKRPLPRFPRVIGVATSQSGAALQDILCELSCRTPRRIGLRCSA